MVSILSPSRIIDYYYSRSISIDMRVSLTLWSHIGSWGDVLKTCIHISAVVFGHLAALCDTANRYLMH